MNSRTSSAGFTLVETVCVLLIFSVVSIMPVLKYSDWRQQRSINQQLNQFERLYEKSQQYAVVGGYTSEIIVDESRQNIVFSYSYPQGQKVETIDMGAYLSISVKINNQSGEGGKIKTLKISAHSGHPSELATFIFRDSLNHRKISYTVQMTNSKVIRHEEIL